MGTRCGVGRRETSVSRLARDEGGHQDGDHVACRGQEGSEPRSQCAQAYSVPARGRGLGARHDWHSTERKRAWRGEACTSAVVTCSMTILSVGIESTCAREQAAGGGRRHERARGATTSHVAPAGPAAGGAGHEEPAPARPGPAGQPGWAAGKEGRGCLVRPGSTIVSRTDRVGG